MEIINGKLIANSILENCMNKLNQISFVPTLTIILVGDNPSSITYVNKKKLAGEKVGIKVEVIHKDTVTAEELVSIIDKLNSDKTVYGIIVQLPLPEINAFEICKHIAIEKDVDGLNPYNFGDLWLNNNSDFIPATVRAIDYVLKFVAKQENTEITNYLDGKKVLIINRSNIIGKPLAGILLRYDTTVTIAHSKTKEIDRLIEQSQIIISGTGILNFIDKQNIYPGTILIDAGFTKIENKVFGDVSQTIDNKNIKWLSTVPGGIGPIGVACLIENVVDFAIKNKS